MPTHLSQVQFENIAYVMGVKLRELNQMFAILKSLAQLLNPRFGTIHPVDALHRTKHTQLFGHLKDKHANVFWHTLFCQKIP